MSKIALTPNASGTGTLTIAAPNTNTDRTLTLPDNTGTVLTDQSTVSSTQIASALNASGSAPIYAARAWVNFDGTGTVAIRASGNVSSITDNGTGDYTVNFTTAMPDANYSVVANTMDPTVSHGVSSAGDVRNTSQVSIATFKNNAITTKADMALVTAAIFR